MQTECCHFAKLDVVHNSKCLGELNYVGSGFV